MATSSTTTVPRTTEPLVIKVRPAAGIGLAILIAGMVAGIFIGRIGHVTVVVPQVPALTRADDFATRHIAKLPELSYADDYATRHMAVIRETRGISLIRDPDYLATLSGQPGVNADGTTVRGVSTAPTPAPVEPTNTFGTQRPR